MTAVTVLSSSRARARARESRAVGIFTEDRAGDVGVGGTVGESTIFPFWGQLVAEILLCNPRPDLTQADESGMISSMETIDVVHGLAVLLPALLVAHGLQALVEHYFPESEATAALRFILGGP